MSTHTTTREARVAHAFRLEGDRWMRHANPVSVWTRFAGLPLLAVSIWSRDWIGWWSLLPIGLSLVFLALNPLLFPVPASTRNWASRGVFGERVYARRDTEPIPAAFRSPVPRITYGVQLFGLVVLAYGLVELGWVGVVAAVTGLVIVQTAKAWCIDRMVLLFAAMKVGREDLRGWEY
jgi:hypothetical protein